jgi:hypothetical protein
VAPATGPAAKVLARFRWRHEECADSPARGAAKQHSPRAYRHADRAPARRNINDQSCFFLRLWTRLLWLLPCFFPLLMASRAIRFGFAPVNHRFPSLTLPPDRIASPVALLRLTEPPGVERARRLPGRGVGSSSCRPSGWS